MGAVIIPYGRGKDSVANECRSQVKKSFTVGWTARHNPHKSAARGHYSGRRGAANAHRRPKKGRVRRGNAQVDRVVCRGRRTGEESCRPKMRLGGAIEGSHRPLGALRRSFATLAPANRAEIAPRTGTVGKVTSLPFSSFNPDLKRVTHWREKFHISYEYSICELNK